MSDIFLFCHGVLVLTDGDHVRQKFLTGRTISSRKSHLEILNFYVFQTQNRLCLSNEVENYLSDGSEISEIMGGPLDTPFYLIPSPGGF